MKTIYILRSVESKSVTDDSDFKRTLTPKGFLQTTAIGKVVFEQHIKIDSIISSTAKRSRIMSTLIKSIGEIAAPIIYDEKIYGGDLRKLIKVIYTNCSDDVDNILLVCHNPGAEMLVKHLVNKNERMYAGSFVKIELDINSWMAIEMGCGVKDLTVHQAPEILLWIKHFSCLSR